MFVDSMLKISAPIKTDYSEMRWAQETPWLCCFKFCSYAVGASTCSVLLHVKFLCLGKHFKYDSNWYSHMQFYMCTDIFGCVFLKYGTW